VDVEAVLTVQQLLRDTDKSPLSNLLFLKNGIDFGGPYPDGHYNLVVIDQRTRYPVAEVVSSNGFKQTKEMLKNTFAYLGIPRRVTSDSGPPFNSEQFKDFAKEKGFVHHRASTNHLRANTQVERFMQTLNKTEQIAHLQGKSGPNRDMTVQDMLMDNRDTPHPATGISHYQAMMNRTKLDYTVPRKERSGRDNMLDEKDRQYRETMVDEGGISKEHNFVRGENADERGQSEDWRDTFDGRSHLKGQPIYQQDAEEENLLELPEQVQSQCRRPQ